MKLFQFQLQNKFRICYMNYFLLLCLAKKTRCSTTCTTHVIRFEKKFYTSRQPASIFFSFARIWALIWKTETELTIVYFDKVYFSKLTDIWALLGDKHHWYSCSFVGIKCLRPGMCRYKAVRIATIKVISHNSQLIMKLLFSSGEACSKHKLLPRVSD